MGHKAVREKGIAMKKYGRGGLVARLWSAMLAAVCCAGLTACSSASSSTTAAEKAGANAATSGKDATKRPSKDSMGYFNMSGAVSGEDFADFIGNEDYTIGELSRNLGADYPLVGPNADITTTSDEAFQAFLNGSAQWANMDRPLTSEELRQTTSVCANGDEAYNVPMLVRSISIVMNTDFDYNASLDIRLDASTLARILQGQITNWNDPALQALNPDLALSSYDMPITVVYRSDSSQINKSLSGYLASQASGYWTSNPSEEWPYSIGVGVTSAKEMMETISNTEGAFGYAVGYDPIIDNERKRALIKTTYDPDMEQGDSSYDEYDAPDGHGIIRGVEDDMIDVSTKGTQVVAKLKYDEMVAGSSYPIVQFLYAVGCVAYRNNSTPSEGSYAEKVGDPIDYNTIMRLWTDSVFTTDPHNDIGDGSQISRIPEGLNTTVRKAAGLDD